MTTRPEQPDATVWIKPDAPGHFCVLIESPTPGLYLVSTELMHQMLDDLGWVPASEEPPC